MVLNSIPEEIWYQSTVKDLKCTGTVVFISQHIGDFLVTQTNNILTKGDSILTVLILMLSMDNVFLDTRRASLKPPQNKQLLFTLSADANFCFCEKKQANKHYLK